MDSEDLQTVERHLYNLIKSFIVSGPYDCEKCLKAGPRALKKQNMEKCQILCSQQHNHKQKETAKSLIYR